MSADFKNEAVDHIIEGLRDTEVFKFIQSLIREAVLRILRPETSVPVVKLTDEELIHHSMIYHFLSTNGYKAAAEVMQAECYERFLTQERLKESLEEYGDDSLSKCLAKCKPKAGTVLQRDEITKKEVIPQTKFSPKPDKEFENTKETLREGIMAFAEEAVKRKEEIRQQEEALSEEEVDEEEVEEGTSESNSASSSTTAESEPEVITTNWTKRIWGPSAHQLSTDTIIATKSPPSRYAGIIF
ncbi:hypothetical protein Y032_0004g1791 [Ancylostoma ceylanicum]|uniref:LisH domain-containing protein n=1 Tax=Ancylostoma ceylanicum TaxID=53326 RepID=A0A016VT96_9BILA|nr:hypothetical protein Y032_0004g1791 [Ancylostoma ceylanicum]